MQNLRLKVQNTKKIKFDTSLKSYGHADWEQNLGLKAKIL